MKTTPAVALLSITLICLLIPHGFTAEAQSTIKEKIQILKSLRDEGSITEEVYNTRVAKILDGLTESKKEDEEKKPEVKQAMSFCVFTGEAVKAEDLNSKDFSENADANAIVKEILDMAGVAPNFVVRSGNVPNAAAIIQGSDRFIYYNPGFVNRVKGTAGSNWSIYSIIAHEIGHHFNGHTLQTGGSRPDLELEADQFSGHMLARMGATLLQAQAAMKLVGSDEDTPTHPGKSRRLAAIAKGFQKAKPTAPDKDPEPPGKNLPPVAPPVRTPEKRTCVHRISCVHKGDCIHQTACIHQAPCQHQGPCIHQMPCGHRIPCQHVFATVYGPRVMHLFDIPHPYDTIHPFDVAHPSDQAHQFDSIHPDGDPQHDFDLQHPDGD